MSQLFMTIAVVHFLALMTPGPDFLFVSQTAVSRSRTDAMLGVLGIVCGVAFWAVLTLVGLQFIFEQFVWLPRIIQLMGGIYLVYLGYRLLLSPSKTLTSYYKALRNKNIKKTSSKKRNQLNSQIQQSSETQNMASNIGSAQHAYVDTPEVVSSTNNTFIYGLLTNLSNPKVIIYFGSVFAPFLGNPDKLGSLIKWELLILIIAETFIWFTIVALIFGLPKLQQVYQRYSIWVDALAGIFFVGFGSHLIFSLKITTFNSILTS